MNSLWDILSVAIGVSFVFLILSILNSWIQECISTLFDLRTKTWRMCCRTCSNRAQAA